MATLNLQVPNPDVADVLAALERAHGVDAVQISQVPYSTLTNAQKASVCLSVYLRRLTKEYRRSVEVERRRSLETPIVVVEPDVS